MSKTRYEAMLRLGVSFDVKLGRTIGATISNTSRIFVAFGTVVAPLQLELYNFSRISLTHHGVMREVETH